MCGVCLSFESEMLRIEIEMTLERGKMSKDLAKV
jgi:hypothetical protein